MFTIQKKETGLYWDGMGWEVLSEAMLFHDSDDAEKELLDIFDDYGDTDLYVVEVADEIEGMRTLMIKDYDTNLFYSAGGWVESPEDAAKYMLHADAERTIREIQHYDVEQLGTRYGVVDSLDYQE
jgi:hypothetical protein